MNTVDSLQIRENEYAIMLIDVEGHELQVLQGAREFIVRRAPLIVFEYNLTTRLHFALQEVRDLLGDQYRFKRLRGSGDGRLDDLLGDTWNIVAYPLGNIWEDAILPLIASRGASV
jgi:hypothetical protein